MKTYTFWVTLANKSPMKVAEDGRTASEARTIVEARFPGARVVFAEGFQWSLRNQIPRSISGYPFLKAFSDWEAVMDFGWWVDPWGNL